MLDRYWAIAPSSMNELLRQEARRERAEVDLTIKAARVQVSVKGGPAYHVVGESGVAIVPVVGAITKYANRFQQLFDGVASTEIASAIRKAAADESVREILLYVDSPGGSVAGTADLADTIARTNETVPVTAYISDRGLSAAYWIVSRAGRIVSNVTAQVGSIGAYAVIDDWSRAFTKQGVETHVIKDGRMKGIGVIGAPVTPEQIAEVKREIQSLNTHFINAVVQGRGLTEKHVRSMNARVYVGEEAREQGLIDAVETLDETIAQLSSRKPNAKAPSAAAKPSAATRITPHTRAHTLAPAADEARRVAFIENRVRPWMDRGYDLSSLRNELVSAENCTADEAAHKILAAVEQQWHEVNSPWPWSSRRGGLGTSRPPLAHG